MRIVISLLVLLLVVPAAAQNPAGPRDDVEFERSELTIRTRTASHRFTVELARTWPQKQRGLMFRRSMPADHGMLLVYDPPRNAAIWMRNTFIPLDLIYIRADGTVHKVHRGAIPHDETPLPSDGPVAAVLEVNAGVVRILGIHPGDTVRHPLFGTGK